MSAASLVSPATLRVTRSLIMIKQSGDKLEKSSDQMQVQTVGLGWHQMDANNHGLSTNSNQITIVDFSSKRNFKSKLYRSNLFTTNIKKSTPHPLTVNIFQTKNKSF